MQKYYTIIGWRDEAGADQIHIGRYLSAMEIMEESAQGLPLRIEPEDWTDKHNFQLLMTVAIFRLNQGKKIYRIFDSASQYETEAFLEQAISAGHGDEARLLIRATAQ